MNESAGLQELAAKECAPCKGGVPPLQGNALQELLRKLDHGWRVEQDHHLEKEFAFKNFKEALRFTNQVGQIAEEVGHHPDIFLAWGKVRIQIFTHKINGLTESDFFLAAKFEEAFQETA